jgi:hypothetical protein
VTSETVARALSAIFRALLPGPLGAEACAELEDEYRSRRDAAGHARATLWFARHLLLPSTWHLAFELRRRARRMVRRLEADGATETGLVRHMGRPPYAAALLVTTLVFLLYAATLAPTTAFWDASEYITTAHTMGIPHPPGNPLFHVLARSWEVLLAPLGLTVAVRINLFSAFMSAAAHGFWFLIVERIRAGSRKIDASRAWALPPPCW